VNGNHGQAPLQTCTPPGHVTSAFLQMTAQFEPAWHRAWQVAAPEQSTWQSPVQVTTQALLPVHATLLPLPTVKVHRELPPHPAAHASPQDTSHV